MRTTQEHRDFASSNATKMSTKALKEVLQGKGLTDTQSNNVVRNQRKKSKLYKKGSANVEVVL